MVAFTGTFADDVFAVREGELIDAVFSFLGNELIVDTATSHTVLTGSR